MIRIHVEPFQVIYENQHLLEEHWDEVATKDNGRSLKVDWDSFFLFEKMGKLVTIVAREEDEVIGYAVFIVMNQLHAFDSMAAHNDALFIKKEYRGSKAGYKLIKESERILGEVYPNILMLWHVKPALDFSPLLKKLGYSEVDIIYGKNIKWE